MSAVVEGPEADSKPNWCGRKVGSKKCAPGSGEPRTRLPSAGAIQGEAGRASGGRGRTAARSLAEGSRRVRGGEVTCGGAGGQGRRKGAAIAQATYAARNHWLAFGGGPSPRRPTSDSGSRSRLVAQPRPPGKRSEAAAGPALRGPGLV